MTIIFRINNIEAGWRGGYRSAPGKGEIMNRVPSVLAEKPTRFSERVVVDELFDGGSVRLLRAKRLAGAPADDLSISCWASETEYIMSAWRVEAFVGFPAGRRLMEGDVFFVLDSRRLTAGYHPEKAGLKRKDAARKHLLVHWDKSREIARKDIKKEFRILHMERALGKTIKPKELERLVAASLVSHEKGKAVRS